MLRTLRIFFTCITYFLLRTLRIYIFEVIMKIENPFVVRGYVSPIYFCNRNKETDKIIESVKNNRNLTIYSLRRIGKTGLIHNAFHKLLKTNNIRLFYVDVFPTSSLSEFTSVLAKEILGKLDSNVGNVISKVGSILSRIRPQITYDPLTAAPSLQIDIKNENEAKATLDEIFRYLSSRDEKIVIAIDEFQQILKYPENNVEALLRKYVQSLKNVVFIFSGSQQEMLLSMFGNKSRPFYQSTQLLHLQKLEKDVYKKFISNKFNKSGQIISGIEIDFILEWANNHTYYVQFLCNRIFSKNMSSISINDIKNEIKEILEENQLMYLNYRNFLTENQWRLLSAIAKENGIKQITSKNFLIKYQLGTASSVKTSIKPLLDKELIYYDLGEYKIYDVFFQKWAEYAD
jgi:AAA+ ATPase superfamily predicted ATPase